MVEEDKNRQQERENPAKQDLAPPDSKQGVQSQSSPAANSEQLVGSSQSEAGSSKQGMSSGAKWGVGIGACCCCLIIIIILVLILGFAGCSMFQFGGLRSWNWPEAPPINEGTEIPVPSFSNIPR